MGDTVVSCVRVCVCVCICARAPRCALPHVPARDAVQADVERGMDAAAEQQQGGLEKLIKALDTKPVVRAVRQLLRTARQRLDVWWAWTDAEATVLGR